MADSLPTPITRKEQYLNAAAQSAGTDGLPTPITREEFYLNAIAETGGGGGTSPSPSSSDPQMDGIASAGIDAQYARGDHRHPSDTTRQPATLSSPITIGGVAQSTVEGALDALATETFSTSETLTNKVWIDEKPIYRKVIKWESSLASGVNEIGSVPNIGELVSASITIRNSAGTAWKDNNTGPTEDLGVSVDVPGGRVVLLATDTWSSPVVIVILEYTKTGT